MTCSLISLNLSIKVTFQRTEQLFCVPFWMSCKCNSTYCYLSRHSNKWTPSITLIGFFRKMNDEPAAIQVERGCDLLPSRNLMCFLSNLERIKFCDIWAVFDISAMHFHFGGGNQKCQKPVLGLCAIFNNFLMACPNLIVKPEYKN